MRARFARNIGGPLAVADNAIDRLPGLFQIWRLTGEPAYSVLGIQKRGSDRLVDFVGNVGCELAHCRDPVRVHQLCLGAFSLGQIEREDDALVLQFAKVCPRHEQRHAAALFPKILFLVWSAGSCSSHLGQGPLVGYGPFGRCQADPAQAIRDDISRLYPTMRRNASLALMRRPSKSKMHSWPSALYSSFNAPDQVVHLKWLSEQGRRTRGGGLGLKVRV
jgi:hypothetical protein